MDGDGIDVAIVTPRYPPVSVGGGQKSAELLATNLAGSDRIGEVTVFAFDGDGHSSSEGVDVRRLGAVPSTVTEYQNLRAASKLRGRVRAYDIVHGYNMELHPTVGFLATREGVASVATLNSYHFFKSAVSNTTATGLERAYELLGHPTTGRVLRRYVRRIDLQIALSHAVQETYERNGFAGCRFEHVPNMVDPAFEVPDDVYSDPETCKLLYVGSLTENKGVGYLIRAMTHLPAQYRLEIVGDGPLHDKLRNLARDLAVTDCVEFLGRVPYDDIPSVYGTTDVFVHPGIWPEPLNRTVLEAMQSTLPVVCTDIGGPPEVINHDECLCDPGNPRSLADAIERVHGSERDIGEKNQAYVWANHAPAVIIEKIIDLYEDLLSPT